MSRALVTEHDDTVAPREVLTPGDRSAPGAIGAFGAGNAAVVQRLEERHKEDSEAVASRGGDAYKGAMATSAATKFATGIADHSGANGADAAGAVGSSSIGLLGSFGQLTQGLGNLSRSYEKSQKGASESNKAESKALDSEARSNLAPATAGIAAGAFGLAATVGGQSSGTGTLGKGFAGLSIVAGLASAYFGVKQMVAAIQRARALSDADPAQMLAKEIQHEAALEKELGDAIDKMKSLAGKDAERPKLAARIAEIESAPESAGRELHLGQAKADLDRCDEAIAAFREAGAAADRIKAQLEHCKRRVEALKRVVEEPVAGGVGAGYAGSMISLGAAQQQFRNAAVRKAWSAGGSAVGGLVTAASGATALGTHGLGDHEKMGFTAGAVAGGAASLGAFGAKLVSGPKDAERLSAAQSVVVAAARQPKPVPEPVPATRPAGDKTFGVLPPSKLATVDEIRTDVERSVAHSILASIKVDPETVVSDARGGKAKHAVEYVLTVAGRA